MMRKWKSHGLLVFEFGLLNQEGKNMSLISKLRAALSVVFLLTTAGAIAATAQTPAVVDSPATKAATSVGPTSEPQS